MILFLDSSGQATARVAQKLRTRLPGVAMEVHTSFPSLYQRLTSLQESSVIAVLAAGSRGQLQEFRKLRELFIEVRIILILPDQEAETVHLGHQLYPRYIGYRDGNSDDLAAVAARLHERQRALAPG